MCNRRRCSRHHRYRSRVSQCNDGEQTTGQLSTMLVFDVHPALAHHFHDLTRSAHPTHALHMHYLPSWAISRTGAGPPRPDAVAAAAATADALPALRFFACVLTVSSCSLLPTYLYDRGSSRTNCPPSRVQRGHIAARSSSTSVRWSVQLPPSLYRILNRLLHRFSVSQNHQKLAAQRTADARKEAQVPFGIL